jgi:hypothetical protein
MLLKIEAKRHANACRHDKKDIDTRIRYLHSSFHRELRSREVNTIILHQHTHSVTLLILAEKLELGVYTQELVFFLV